MITFLWGCLVIFFKGCIGSVLFTFGVAIITLIFGGIIGLIGLLIDNIKPKTRAKPIQDEDYKKWAEKQEGELKSLVDEIDKDLK